MEGKKLKRLFQALAREKKFTAPLIKQFEEEFGEKFYKALEFLEDDGPKVYKYHFFPSNSIIWLVQGKERKYIVYPELYCECKAFLMESIYREKKFCYCKHLLAQKIAYILQKTIKKKKPDQKFTEL